MFRKIKILDDGLLYFIFPRPRRQYQASKIFWDKGGFFMMIFVLRVKTTDEDKIINGVYKK